MQKIQAVLAFVLVGVLTVILAAWFAFRLIYDYKNPFMWAETAIPIYLVWMGRKDLKKIIATAGPYETEEERTRDIARIAMQVMRNWLKRALVIIAVGVVVALLQGVIELLL